jgi:hypothetical protein
MNILLFTLLCLLTILFLRVIQRGSRPRGHGSVPEKEPDAPAARSDEIVDVDFEEVPAGDRNRKGTP